MKVIMDKSDRMYTTGEIGTKKAIVIRHLSYLEPHLNEIIKSINENKITDPSQTKSKAGRILNF